MRKLCHLNPFEFFDHRGLAPDCVDFLTGCSGNVRLLQGYHLFREDDETNQFYLIRKSMVCRRFKCWRKYSDTLTQTRKEIPDG